MNPVIVIPSYWAATDQLAEVGDVGTYDHVTPISKPLPELETCLASLEQVRGVLRVIVLVVAPPSCADSARARVDGICRTHPNLNVVVIGRPEAALITQAVERIAPAMEGEPLSLRGYGAIRNMGLAAAAVLGHDVVVFLDDDEVALDENFLINAVYGIGLQTRQGLLICAKSGYFLNNEDSPYAPDDEPAWYDQWWSRRKEFNHWMRRALAGTRITRSNIVCGGCFAVSAEAFTAVPFDPQITRGEDLDYLLNLRMYGYDVWFDNEWCVRHLPPKTPSHASRFLQNVYRWMYEVAKLEASNHIIGLHHVTPESLRPYPEPWIRPDELPRRVALTSLARALACTEHRAYLGVFFRGRRQAATWALSVAKSYFSLQTYWPRIMNSLWENKALAEQLISLGTPAVVVPRLGGKALGSLDDAIPAAEGTGE